MRKLIYGMLTSLDLFVEDRTGNFDWATPDEELHRHFNERAAEMTTHLYGRRMWETMSGYWPKRSKIRSRSRVTFARLERGRARRVLAHADLGRSRRTPRQDRCRRRGQTPQGRRRQPIEVSGPGLASRLLAAGLVDELRRLHQPGRRRWRQAVLRARPPVDCASSASRRSPAVSSSCATRGASALAPAAEVEAARDPCEAGEVHLLRLDLGVVGRHRRVLADEHVEAPPITGAIATSGVTR